MIVMSGYIILLTTVTSYLLSGSHAMPPKFVKRVSKCPQPNNITEWEKASAELACFYPIQGGPSHQQDHIYHCLPSSFLNESVEYCGISGAVEKGYCPVYKYVNTSGLNRAITYLPCTNFKSGCPEDFYFSKEVYKYPACLNVNPVDKCYIAEPMCAKNYDVLDANNHTEPSTTKFDEKDDENNDTKFIIVIVVIIVFIPAVFAIILYILWRKKNLCFSPRNRQGQNDAYLQQNGRIETQDTESDSMLPDGSQDGQILTEGPSISKIPFSLLLTDISKALTEHQMDYIRNVLKDIGEGESCMNSSRDALRKMADRFNLEHNILYLQAILMKFSNTSRESQNLVEKCRRYAKTKSSVFFLEKDERPPVGGYRDAYIHIKGSDISSIQIEEVKTVIAQILEMEPELVIYRGGEVSQRFLLKFMIPEQNAKMLQEKEVIYSFELSKIGVDFLRFHEKEIQVHLPDTKVQDTNDLDNTTDSLMERSVPFDGEESAYHGTLISNKAHDTGDWKSISLTEKDPLMDSPIPFPYGESACHDTNVQDTNDLDNTTDSLMERSVSFGGEESACHGALISNKAQDTGDWKSISLTEKDPLMNSSIPFPYGESACHDDSCDDPWRASRTPNADRVLRIPTRYTNPAFSSPSRILDSEIQNKADKKTSACFRTESLKYPDRPKITTITKRKGSL